MLKVEVDIFSGRPNPTWIVTDSNEVKSILGAVAEARKGVAKPGAGHTGLGYRDVRVSFIGDDEPRPKGLAGEFAVGSIAAPDRKASLELAQHVIRGMLNHRDARLVHHDITPLDERVLAFTKEQLKGLFDRAPKLPRPKPPPRSNPLRKTVHDGKCERCEYEISKFNPGFWNKPAVQPHNNCYNYARNWRTDTFAQPGRAHGAMTSIMKCAEVTTAALADGLKKRCDCLSNEEWPRRLMALVIAPGWDYHWYREQRDGFWGHKPGKTAARNTDNVGAVIANPETANRGPYTDFCGYFYAGKSVVIS